MSSIGEHVDRLSSLPQDVLSYILSLMPTKFAVRTSLLSKTWRYTWTFVHNLNFDTSDDQRYINPKHVDWVLERCKTSQVQIFRVHSSFYISEFYLGELISKAIRLNVSELDMKGGYLRLPTSLFTCGTLTKLKLDCPSFYWPSFVNLPNLKTLDVVIRGQYCESALKLIHGCPVLESLYVEMDYWNDEGDNYFKIPTLKRFNLKLNFTCSELTTDVVLNLPNLEYFFFDGFLDFPFVIEETRYLIEAKASCVVYHGDQLVQLLKAINQAKSIYLNTMDPSGGDDHLDSSGGDDHLDFPMFFPNLKQLVLEGYVGPQWNLIPQFLQRSPKLEHLSIGTALHDYGWNRLKSIPTCMRVSLKTVKYKDGCDYHDFEFLKFIFSYSKVLKTLTVECDPTSSLILRANLTKLRKASIKGEIRLQFRSPINKSIPELTVSRDGPFSETFCTTALDHMNTAFKLVPPIIFYCFLLVALC